MTGAFPYGSVRKRRKLLSFYHRLLAENLRLRNLWGSSVAVKKQDAKAAPRRKAAKKPFDFRLLRRMALWSVAAACALMLAVLTSKSEGGAERLAAVMASLRGEQAPPPFDARVETRKLGNALRSLSSDDDQLRSRLSAVERHVDAVERHVDQVDEVTGSLKKQIEAVKAEAEAPRPADTPPAAATPVGGATVPSTVPPSPTPSPLPVPPPKGVQAPPAVKPTVPGSSSINAPKQYGVDIGSAVSFQALRVRWAEIRAAHPQLFQGLTAKTITRGIPQSDRSEVRLVLGPLPNSDAATRLCTLLAPYHVFCQPTGFDGQQLALQ
jgi:hypothetical protein